MPAVLEARSRSRSAQALTGGSQPAPNMLAGLPNELLQRMLFFAVFDNDASNDSHQTLHNVCRVDREWHSTATNYPALWTKLPVADLGVRDQTLTSCLRALTLYLTRSGVLPISFKLSVPDTVWNLHTKLYRDTVDIIIQLLIDQCHRWEEVEMRCSGTVYERLGRVKGKLPMLTSLSLALPYLYLRDKAFDVFGDAPRLRDVKYSIQHCPEDSPPPSFLWSQLENVYYAVHSESVEVYHTIMDAQPTFLRTLEYSARTFRLLPLAITIPLPHLEKLSLRIATDIECDIFSHLDTLTLPTLTHLELWGKLHIANQDAYDAIRTLVERSGCSLRMLFMCLSDNELADANNFKKLIALSPDLEVLHLTVPKSEVLEALVLKPTSPEPVLPKLRRLGLHSHGPSSWDVTLLDGKVLATIIESRTRALVDQEEPHQYQTLDEVIFVYYANVGVQYGVIRESFLEELDQNVHQKSNAKITKVIEGLHWNFTERGSWLYRRRNYNPIFLAKMEGVIRGLESLNFKKRDTEVLLRHGLPSVMHRIGHYRDPHGARPLPADIVLLFRARARRLVRKWKPFVLRDAHTAKYRWCYYGGGVVSLKWNGSSKGAYFMSGVYVQRD
ncbi:hypothetical protein FA13DRAFT_1734562 [Coprinellus micaceus]|uniref:F-box domain-containing protein n=1 Tax=Coprinellus micaceus TaxID=71717 RepID=A0A4Y7T6Z9_COPMI|nr:hypothetical protein FA13DRAFT_1734562 [Coprinellus micaceus]